MNKFLTCLFISVCLSGCSTYSSKFDCPHGQGLGCASVSKVNKLLDAQMVDTEDRLSVGTSSSTTPVSIYFGPERPAQVMTYNGIPVL